MSHGGKGDDRRPEGQKGAYARGFADVDWTARLRDAALHLVVDGLHAHGVTTAVEVKHCGGDEWAIDFPLLELHVGGMVSERRTLIDLASVAVQRATEALAP